MNTFVVNSRTKNTTYFEFLQNVKNLKYIFKIPFLQISTEQEKNARAQGSI